MRQETTLLPPTAARPAAPIRLKTPWAPMTMTTLLPPTAARPSAPIRVTTPWAPMTMTAPPHPPQRTARPPAHLARASTRTRSCSSPPSTPSFSRHYLASLGSSVCAQQSSAGTASSSRAYSARQSAARAGWARTPSSRSCPAAESPGCRSCTPVRSSSWQSPLRAITHALSPGVRCSPRRGLLGSGSASRSLWSEKKWTPPTAPLRQRWCESRGAESSAGTASAMAPCSTPCFRATLWGS